MRYELMQVSESDPDYYDPLTFKEPRRALSSFPYEVNRADIMRPDILAVRAYGNYDIWDLILMFNGIIYWGDLQEQEAVKIFDNQELSNFIYRERNV